MKQFFTILEIETLKVLKSKILYGTLIFFVFITVIVALLTYLVKHPELMGNSAMLSAKASMIKNADWPSYFGLLIQIILTAGAFGFGITASWIFGREFVDLVIKDLLALPVSRVSIVLGKFVVLLVWNTILAVIVLGVSLLMGIIVGLDNWSTTIVVQISIRFLGSALLTILLCTPISFLASLSRGYLLPVGVIILTMIITQMAFIGVPSVTPYLPWAIPGLYSGVAGPAAPEAGMVSYTILAITSAAGISGTALWWRFADQM